MLFAGFNVSTGDMTLFGIDRRGRRRQRRRLLDRLRGRLLRAARAARQEPLHPHQPASTSSGPTRWFQRHGDATVLVSRMLPIIRTFISLPAGVARMPFWRFTVLTLLGCIPWVLALALIGREVGDNWEDWRDNLHYLDYAVARRDRRRRRLPADPPPPHAARLERTATEADAARAPRPEPRAGARPSARSRARPSCSRSRAPPTCRSSPGSPAGAASEIDPEARKSFEVALHGGTAAALLIGQRRMIAARAGRLRRPPRGGRRALVRPAGDRRLPLRVGDRDAARRPAATAAGLVAGAVAMAARRPRARRSAARARPAPLDGLALGIAQASALAPGRLAKRRHAGRGPGARVHPRAGQPALADRRPAGDRRRDRAQGRAAAPARRPAGLRPGARRRRRGVVRLDAGLAAADRPGRARPRAVAVRGLPGRPRGRGRGQNDGRRERPPTLRESRRQPARTPTARSRPWSAA